MEQNKKGRWWPWMLALLLISGSAFNLFMVSMALNDPSFAVETNYYKKALRWDQTMAEKRKSEQLGWTIKAKAKPQIANRKAMIQVEAQIFDRKGKIVKGAHVSLEAFHNGRSKRRFHKDLGRTNDVHKVTINSYRSGLWVFHYTVLRGKQRFMQVIRQEI